MIGEGAKGIQQGLESARGCMRYAEGTEAYEGCIVVCKWLAQCKHSGLE